MNLKIKSTKTYKSGKILIFADMLILLLSCSAEKIRTEIADMRCEYLVSPICVDAAAPRFTWTYRCPEPDNREQGYCQIDIASVKSLLDEGEPGDIWSSSQTRTGNSYFQYTGKVPLESHRKYYWQIKAWDKKELFLAQSVIDSFETAKMSANEWIADWITDQHDKTFGPAPMMRKRFLLNKQVQSARIYISACAYYRLYLNEQIVGTEKLGPGYTHYDKRNLYSTIDVTRQLQQGENVLTTVLGNGFYNEDAPVATWDFEKAPWRDRPKMILELLLRYQDGTYDLIKTDENWKTTTGPHIYNNIYSGESYDAREEISGWNQPDFDDSGWDNAILANFPSPILVSQAMPAIEITREITPQSVRSFGDTLFVFDMGINMSGVCKLKLSGAKGTKVTLMHGELLKENGRVEMRNLDIYYKPVKGIEFQTDTYIMKGGEEETFIPEFTYHGFRYVEVRSDQPMSLKEDNLSALFMHTALESVGKFSCSNALLNKIWEATNQSYLSNLHSIPTDCPQREKNGWTADAHIAIDLGLLNFDGISLYEKWMNDFIDNQQPAGNISGIIPSSGWGYDDWIGPVWDAAIFIIPDALERYYGDTRAIHKIYNTCENYLNYLKNREDENGTITYGIGDWVCYNTQTPTDYTTTCFYYWDNVLMARFAETTGNSGDRYKEKAESLRSFINKKYFNQQTCLYANGSQTAQAVALAFDIVPDEYEAKVAEKLNKAIVENNYHLDFGVLGSKYVPRMLSKHGYAETAYKMATQETAPSWGNWIKLGFTTLAETWVLSPEFRDASVNHVFLGDISAWMVNTLAGINYDSENRGFEKIIIKPDYIEDLSWVKGEYKSVKGLIKSEWMKKGDKIKLSVTIPANTTATIYTDRIAEVKGGYYEFTFKK